MKIKFINNKFNYNKKLKIITGALFLSITLTGCQNNKVNEEVAISMDQISFDIVKDNNILDEIKNLDILSMTPLDAMNALFSLQKKVKNK